MTGRFALALPPDPYNAATPRMVWPTTKDTEPVGDVTPETALTVAVKTVLPPDAILAGFAASAVPVGVAVLAAHAPTSL